jgi:hypothetical protein
VFALTNLSILFHLRWRKVVTNSSFRPRQNSSYLWILTKVSHGLATANSEASR